jgi:acetyltransferase-like isoleucine patch superfamily enzyme
MQGFVKTLLRSIGLWRDILVHANTNTKSIRGGRNSVCYKDATLRSVSFDIIGSGNHILIKSGCVLNKVTFYIRGDNHRILIHDHCRFNDGASIWLEGDNCALEIGRESTFENVHLALTEQGSKLSIGQDCMFAYGIEVRTGDSHSVMARDTNERINHVKDVSIGDHVWIAAHCTILKGVSIAAHSIVATGAVVTKSFDTEGLVIGGNPAIKLKEGITWSRERIPRVATRTRNE